MPKALKQKQEYGIPLSRYTVFLQNCPLGHDPKSEVFFYHLKLMQTKIHCTSIDIIIKKTDTGGNLCLFFTYIT